MLLNLDQGVTQNLVITSWAITLQMPECTLVKVVLKLEKNTRTARTTKDRRVIASNHRHTLCRRLGGYPVVDSALQSGLLLARDHVSAILGHIPVGGDHERGHDANDRNDDDDFDERESSAVVKVQWAHRANELLRLVEQSSGPEFQVGESIRLSFR